MCREVREVRAAHHRAQDDGEIGNNIVFYRCLFRQQPVVVGVLDPGMMEVGCHNLPCNLCSKHGHSLRSQHLAHCTVETTSTIFNRSMSTACFLTKRTFVQNVTLLDFIDNSRTKYELSFTIWS